MTELKMSKPQDSQEEHAGASKVDGEKRQEKRLYNTLVFEQLKTPSLRKVCAKFMEDIGFIRHPFRSLLDSVGFLFCLLPPKMILSELFHKVAFLEGTGIFAILFLQKVTFSIFGCKIS